jgi:hypothetical protein
MLDKQKKEPGDAVVTTVLFDDKYVLLHDRINIRGVNPITAKEYFVEGSTALLDAVGKTIQKIGSVQANTGEGERAEKVMFVITTDGMENASREYTFEKVKGLIDRQKERYGWEFIFLGANIDAVDTAARIGIDKSRASNYNADSVGTKLNYQAVSSAVSNLRANKSMDNWNEAVEADYQKRGKKK